MKKYDIKKIGMRAFWLFVIGCIVGYLVETIVFLIQTGDLQARQGLLYGPFIPVYGVGAVVYYFTIRNTKKTAKIFIYSMILGGVTEYLFSFLEEYFFGIVSWDYSHLWFNINGRTSLLHCIYWGLAGVWFVKQVYPIFEKKIEEIENKLKTNFRYITAMIAVFMLFNIGITSIVGIRQHERMRHISKNNIVVNFIDIAYPEEEIDAFYANKYIRLSEETKK